MAPAAASPVAISSSASVVIPGEDASPATRSTRAAARQALVRELLGRLRPGPARGAGRSRRSPVARPGRHGTPRRHHARPPTARHARGRRRPAPRASSSRWHFKSCRPTPTSTGRSAQAGSGRAARSGSRIVFVNRPSAATRRSYRRRASVWSGISSSRPLGPRASRTSSASGRRAPRGSFFERDLRTFGKSSFSSSSTWCSTRSFSTDILRGATVVLGP